MKHLICDVCKKVVENPLPTRTFFHYREFDLCEACNDDLELAVKYTVRNRQPFDFSWLETMKVDIIRTGINKNRITTGK